MANYELSKFYEKTVLKPDEEALKQLNEEALTAEGTENKKLYVSLGEMYKEAVLRVNETVVNPNLTDVYLNNLDALTDGRVAFTCLWQSDVARAFDAGQLQGNIQQLNAEELQLLLPEVD
jgi:hypothetical protein